MGFFERDNAAKRSPRTRQALVRAAPLFVAAALLAACNIVAGLDKFEAADPPCGSGVCGRDAGDTHDSSDAAPDAVRETGVPDSAPPLVVDVRRLWARWSVSDVDAGADASVYSVESAGLVRDAVTGMAWEQVATKASTLDEATAHCASRIPQMVVPSRIELTTLLAFGRASSATGTALVDPIFTPDAGADAEALGTTYWALNGYEVDFATGVAKRGAGSVVRCVRLEPKFGVQ